MRNTTDKTLGLFVIRRPSDSAATKARVLRDTQAWAAPIQNFYTAVSYPYWNVDVRVFPRALSSSESTLPHIYGQETIEAALQSGDFEGFDPNYLGAVGGWNQGFGGHGQVGGNRFVVYDGYGEIVARHEWGHNLGRAHANTLLDGRIAHYGDNTAVMGGYPGRGYGFNAVGRWWLGLETDREVIELTESAIINLAPIELLDFGLRDDEHCVARFKIRGIWYFLSTRKCANDDRSKGHPLALPAVYRDKLFLHKFDRDSIRILPDLVEGGSHTIENVTVEYIKYAPERATVEVRIE